MEEEENLTTHLAPFAATALEMSTLRERQREREREERDAEKWLCSEAQGEESIALKYLNRTHLGCRIVSRG
jgi:GAF domain-containing protein